MKLPDESFPMNEASAREIMARPLPNPTTPGVSDAIQRIEADMILEGYGAPEIRQAIEANFP